MRGSHLPRLQDALARCPIGRSRRAMPRLQPHKYTEGKKRHLSTTDNNEDGMEGGEGVHWRDQRGWDGGRREVRIEVGDEGMREGGMQESERR